MSKFCTIYASWAKGTVNKITNERKPVFNILTKTDCGKGSTDEVFSIMNYSFDFFRSRGRKFTQ